MVSAIQSCVRAVDSVTARVYLSLFTERNSLVAFLFHSLFRDETEAHSPVVDPLQRTTVAQFRQLIAHYHQNGYRFVNPEQILAGLDPQLKYAALTFDDGYFNNSLALPVLEEFNVPATVFVSTEHSRLGKSFWWDVLYRERLAQGASHHTIYREGVALKAMRAHHVEEVLASRFGEDAFRIRGDVDRPFTPDELRKFAQHPLVHIGNHTANHAILTNYPRELVRQELLASQQWLEDVTGKRPISIAYPNGAYSDMVREVCQEIGLTVGFTIRPEKNNLDEHGVPSHLMEISRFAPHDEYSMEAQCRTYRSDFLIYAQAREAYLRLAGRKVVR